LTVANPMAVLGEGATGLLQHKSPEIMQLEGYLLVGGSITTVAMLGIIKCATKAIVIISIVLNLGILFGTAMMNLMVMNLPGAAMFGTIFLLKSCWFWCIRHKFDYAVKLIHAGVVSVENIMGVCAWVLGLFLIAMQAGVVILVAGAWYLLTGENAPPEAAQLNAISPMAIPVLLFFSMQWVGEVIANVFHVSICCCLGAACGVRTPAKSVCGSFCFAVTGGLGSICSGSFIIAALKAAQYAFEKGENSSNPVVKLVVAAACCAIQWILKLFNSYAFVFVGLKGAGYVEGAHRTVAAFAKDGVAAVAADEALHDVMHIAKLVSTWVAVLLALIFGHALNIIGLSARSWQEVITGPVLCIALAIITSNALSLVMGRLVEAAVCTLFIIFDDEKYGPLMQVAQPDLYNQLSDTCKPKDPAE